MLKNPQSILFNTALRRKVSFLERGEAERLIREPVSEVLWYDDLAVENSLGRLSARYRREDDRVVVERELTLTEIEVTPERRQDAQELRDALRVANTAALVFESPEP